MIDLEETFVFYPFDGFSDMYDTYREFYNKYFSALENKTKKTIKEYEKVKDSFNNLKDDLNDK